MADSKFEKKLDFFSKREVIKKKDFVTYIKILVDLTKLLEQNGFHVYGPVVKKWISGFETIFSERKTKDNSKIFSQKFMSEFCPTVTETFFALLQCVCQFDPKYAQYVYIHWKAIVSRMSGLKRADTFLTNIDNFKIVIQHLRTAEQRCEQLAILSVLRLYIECVPLGELVKLRENDNVPIINAIIKLMDNPSIYNQHQFFHDVDAMGHCIESLKPKRIVCKLLQVDCNNSEYEIWLDFNKKNHSVVFIMISLTDSTKQIFGQGGSIKLRESIYDDRMLEINGKWTAAMSKKTSIHKAATVNIFLLNPIESSISRSVRNSFRFVNPKAATGASAAEGFTTDYTDREPLANKNEMAISPEALQRLNESVIPLRFKQLERMDNTLSLPLQSHSLQPFENLNASKENINPNDLVSVDKQSIAARNVEERATDTGALYVVSQSTNSADDNRSVTSNLTYVVRETVNPIASQQSENDLVSYGNVSTNIEDPPENASDATREQYPIRWMANDDVSSGCEFYDEISVADDLENDDDILDGVNERISDGGGVPNGNRIEILENIMIAPPVTPVDYLPRTGTVKFLHFTQVDERVSANRKESFKVFSQPETSRERSIVKRLPIQWRNTETIQRNDNVVQSTQQSIEVASDYNSQMKKSVQNMRKRSMAPVTPIASQKKFKRSDGTLELSTENLRLTPQHEAVLQPTIVSPVVKVEASTSTRYPSQKPAARSLLGLDERFPPATALPSGIPLQHRTEMPESHIQSGRGSQKLFDGRIKLALPQRSGSIATIDPPADALKPLNSSRKQATPKVSLLNEGVTITDLPDDTENITTQQRPIIFRSQVRSASGSQKVSSQKLPVIDSSEKSSQLKLSQEASKQRPSIKDLTCEKPLNSSQECSKISNEHSAFPSNSKALNLSKDQAPRLPEIIDLPENYDGFQGPLNLSQRQKPQQNEMVTNFDDSKEWPLHSPRKRAKMMTQSASLQQTNSTEKPKVLKEAAKTAKRKISKANKKQTTQTSKKESIEMRYSSLKRNKTATIASDGPTSTNDPSSIESVVHIDDSGKVFDDKGCVFADNDEMQRAARFYIANNGLDYMKTERFKGQAAAERVKYERKLKAIHDMMNRGLEEFHKNDNKKIVEADPYEPTIADVTVQGKKRKNASQYKKVSVTLSERRATVNDKSKKVTFSRRVSKLFYIVDENDSSNGKLEPTITKYKSALKKKTFFDKPKSSTKPSEKNKSDQETAVPPKRGESSSNHDSPLLECDQLTDVKSAESGATPKKLPIYASSKVMIQNQHNKISSTIKSTRAVKKSPFRASKKKIAASQQKVISSTVGKEIPSAHVSCVAQSIANKLKSVTVDEPLEYAEDRVDDCNPNSSEMVRELCTLQTCSNNLKNLIDDLKEIATESLQASCEQHRIILTKLIDGLHLNVKLKQSPTATDCLKLLNGILATVEAICEEASEQFNVQDKTNKQSKLL